MVDLLADEVTRYVDPACGCGDLFLAASRRLPIEATLEETLAVWNRHLIRRDLVPEFAAAARARITIAAVARGAKPVGIVSRPAALLTNIRSGDGLQLDFAAGDAVLLNPPYGLVVAPDGCGWCAGLTTAAAVFVDGFSTAVPEVLSLWQSCQRCYGVARATGSFALQLTGA